jgi:hypothetical protein
VLDISVFKRNVRPCPSTKNKEPGKVPGSDDVGTVQNYRLQEPSAIQSSVTNFSTGY